MLILLERKLAKCLKISEIILIQNFTCHYSFSGLQIIRLQVSVNFALISFKSIPTLRTSNLKRSHTIIYYNTNQKIRTWMKYSENFSIIRLRFKIENKLRKTFYLSKNCQYILLITISYSKSRFWDSSSLHIVTVQFYTFSITINNFSI